MGGVKTAIVWCDYMAMFRRYMSLTRPQKSALLLAFDLTLVPAAFFVALQLQYSRVWPLLPLRANWGLVPLLMAVAAVAIVLIGLHRVRLKQYQGKAIVQTVWVAAILGVTSALLAKFGDLRLPNGFHFILAVIYFIGYVGARQLMLSTLTQLYRRSHIVTRVAIYGTGRTGMALANELRHSDDIMAYAFLDDNASMEGMVLNGLPVYSGVHAAKLKEHFNVNRIILAMPSLSLDKQTFLATRLGDLGFEAQTLPAFAQIFGGDALISKLMPSTPASLLARDPLDQRMDTGCAAYRAANVMITGAGGSIGLELCRQIMTCRPARLILFDISEFALYTAEAEMRVLADTVGVEIVTVLGSIADQQHVAQALARHDVDVVLHAAAYKHVPIVEANARVGLANNSLGTAVLARAARDAGVKRFVLVSSDKAVRPGNLMGASKRFAELIVQDLATRSERTIFSIVRFGNVLGSSGSVIPKFREQIARGGPVTLTNERVTRYFMTIEEATRLVLLAGSFAEGGEVFVLDMGKPIRIGDLARKMIEAAGYTVRDAANPEGDIEIVTTGLRPGEKLHEELSYRQGAQTTAHPKIIRVREHHLSEIEMAAALRSLRDAVESGSDEAVISVVARTVREYAPQGLPDSAPQRRAVASRDAGDTPAE